MESLKSVRICINPHCYFIILFFVFIFQHEIIAQQTKVFLNVPPAAGVQAKLIGYHGFKMDTLASFTLDKSGIGSAEVKYNGFALLILSEGIQFPLILKNKICNFNLPDYESTPVFTNDGENNFLYKYLVIKGNSDRAKYYLKDAFTFFNENDKYYHVLSETDSINAVKAVAIDKMLIDSAKYFTSTILQAKALMETTYTIKTVDDLAARKKDFLNFIQKKYTDLQYSDMPQQLAAQYVMMNEYVLIGREKHYAQVLADVGDWNTALGLVFSPKDITQFFVKFFVSRSMTTLAGMISDKYIEYAHCPYVNEGKNKTVKKLSESINSLSIISSSITEPPVVISKFNDSQKILFFFSSDCPTSFPEHIAVNIFLQSNVSLIPNIAVFKQGDAKQSIPALIKMQTNNFYFTESDDLFNIAGIESVPAYIVLGKDNTIVQKFYDIEKLKAFLTSSK